MPTASGTTTTLTVPDAASAGQTFTARATVRVPARAATVRDLTVRLGLPSGWTATAPAPRSVAVVRPGQAVTFRWTVHTPTGTVGAASAITATARYTQRGRAGTSRDERIVRSIPPVPPAGTDAVSDLPFLSSSNGWGPVERDQSVNGQAAGDGKPLTIAGTKYAKGLGTNSVSEVQLYLGGACSRFTAQVGVDDETNGAGTVTFSVTADGRTLVTTPTLKGRSAAVPVDVDVTGAQVLDLVVGDAGDGNGNDHGDWVLPTLTCT